MTFAKKILIATAAFIFGSALTVHAQAPTSGGSCYDPSTHVVSCNVADDQCSATNYWYEPNYKSKHSGCCHCRASCDDVSDECAYNDDAKEDTHHGEGEESDGSCYDPSTHVVACDVADNECSATSYWYEPNYKSKHSGCCHCSASCDDVSEECTYNDDIKEETTFGEGEKSDGSCYDPSTHVVACDVADNECSATSYWYEPNFKSKHSGCCHCRASCDDVSDECTYNDDAKEDTHHGEGEESDGSCYDITTHVVACDVSDEQCPAASYWYEPNFKSRHSGCCHCRASCDDVSEECTYNDDIKEETTFGEGESNGSCYDPTTHEISCDTSDKACPKSSYWYEPNHKSKSTNCCHCRASCDNVSDSCEYNDDVYSTGSEGDDSSATTPGGEDSTTETTTETVADTTKDSETNAGSTTEPVADTTKDSETNAGSTTDDVTDNDAAAPAVVSEGSHSVSAGAEVLVCAFIASQILAIFS